MINRRKRPTFAVASGPFSTVDYDPSIPTLRTGQAFQHAQFRAARWPDPDYPAQLHVDDRFPGGSESATHRVEQLGAIHVSRGTFADPAGHPFCL
jgi:hypothetical protein